MRVVAWLVVTVGGAVASGQWGGGPVVLVWVALCVAFAVTAHKLTWPDALRLWALVLGFLAVLIGGMVVLESRFGGFAAGLWLAFCVVMLVILRRRLIRLVPMLHVATTFDEVFDQRPRERSSALVGCLGIAGFLAGMMLFIALWGEAGGAVWFALFFVVVLSLVAVHRRRPSADAGDES